MKLRIVAAREGAGWVKRAVRTVLAHPIGFATLYLSMLFVWLLLFIIPFIGPLLMLASVPLAWLAFMVATEVAIAGGTPSVAALLRTLRLDRARAKSLALLGLVFVGAVFLVMWIGNLVDGGAYESLVNAMQAGQITTEAAMASLESDSMRIASLVRIVLLFGLAVTFWHAPALVYWDRQSAAKSLFSSTFACWANRRAIAVFGLTWFAVSVLLGVLLSTTGALLTLVAPAALFDALALPIVLLFATVFYVSLYFSFADCFDLAVVEPQAVEV
jgi:hypothetical protein